jgi:hypothetical protein
MPPATSYRLGFVATDLAALEHFETLVIDDADPIVGIAKVLPNAYTPQALQHAASYSPFILTLASGAGKNLLMTGGNKGEARRLGSLAITSWTTQLDFE